MDSSKLHKLGLPSLALPAPNIVYQLVSMTQLYSFVVEIAPISCFMSIISKYKKSQCSKEIVKANSVFGLFNLHCFAGSFCFFFFDESIKLQ